MNGERYISHQADTILPFLADCRTVLDFGCGDMGLDRALVRRNTKIHITGTDVAGRPVVTGKRLSFIPYGGNALPFKSKSFDAVIAYHVFHHCTDPGRAFAQCVRVARKKLVIVDVVLRQAWEKPLFVLADTYSNAWRPEKIPMPYGVRDEEWWRATFFKHPLDWMVERKAGFMPDWLPFGSTRLFVLEKR